MPDLVESLGGDATTERLTIERLITRGDAQDWLRYLRERTQTLTTFVDANGTTDDAARFGAILRDQYLLAQGVVDLTRPDADALATLEGLRVLGST